MDKEPRQIECEEAIRLLLDYLDHELDRDHSQSLENHLHTCRSCFTRMEFEKRLKHIIKDSGKEQASGNLRNRIKNITQNF